MQAVLFPAENDCFQKEANLSIPLIPSVKEVASIVLRCFLRLFPHWYFLCAGKYVLYCVCMEPEVTEDSAYQS